MGAIPPPPRADPPSGSNHAARHPIHVPTRARGHWTFGQRQVDGRTRAGPARHRPRASHVDDPRPSTRRGPGRARAPLRGRRDVRPAGGGTVLPRDRVAPRTPVSVRVAAPRARRDRADRHDHGASRPSSTCSTTTSRTGSSTKSRTRSNARVDRLSERGTSTDEVEARLIGHAAEIDAGRAIADRVFINAHGLDDLVVQIADALCADTMTAVRS